MLAASNLQKYGHVHIAKTGGTSVNGILALTNENVCGHKGYSYDYNLVNKNPGRNDVISRQYPGYSRGRVPINVMNEIGYEDCQYISNEVGWKFWTRFPNITLHVPCRPPLDHLLSQCNHIKKHFDFNGNLRKQIQHCLFTKDRFDMQLYNYNITMQCYKTETQFDSYVPFMQHTLQKKSSYNTQEYKHRHTNRIRNKTHELKDSNNTVIKNVIRILFEEWNYYGFCKKCLNSKKEIIYKTTL